MSAISRRPKYWNCKSFSGRYITSITSPSPTISTCHASRSYRSWRFLHNVHGKAGITKFFPFNALRSECRQCVCIIILFIAPYRRIAHNPDFASSHPIWRHRRSLRACAYLQRGLCINVTMYIDLMIYSSLVHHLGMMMMRS